MTKPHAKQIREAAKLITQAKRPVLYVGGGVIKAGATAELKVLAELTGAPVTTTLMALGAFPDSHPLHVGMPGMHGAVTAVTALQKADLIVALGARFDDRVTGKLDSFAPYAKIVHADIDPAEIGKNRTADVPIVGDAREVIADLVQAVQAEHSEGHTGDYTAWWKDLNRWRETYPLGYDLPEDGSLSPQQVIQRIGELAPEGTIFAAGVGQHQMWAAHFINYEQPATWLNSGGAGTMGYAVPAAMGAKAGMPDRTVWAIDGDGCFQMTNQELTTCALNNIPIKVAIINNGALGHGPPVADPLLQPALLQHRPALAAADGRLPVGASPAARAPASRTSSSCPRPWAASRCAARTRPTWTRSSPRPTRSTTARSWSTSSSTRTPWSGRWSPPAPPTTRSWPPAASAPTSATTKTTEPRAERRGTTHMSKHTLSVLVENTPGILARIAALFSRRGFNIDSLAVGVTEHPDISRITIVVNVEDLPAGAGDQAAQQAGQRSEDRRTGARRRDPARTRPGEGPRRQRDPLPDRRDRPAVPRQDRGRLPGGRHHRGHRRSDKLEAMLKMLEQFGIKELVQSGTIAIGRGARSITDRSLRALDRSA